MSYCTRECRTGKSIIRTRRQQMRLKNFVNELIETLKKNANTKTPNADSFFHAVPLIQTENLSSFKTTLTVAGTQSAASPPNTELFLR